GRLLKGSLPLQELAEGPPGNVLHHDIVVRTGLPAIMHRDDVGMGQPPGRLRFLTEPEAELLVPGEDVGEYFDRAGPPVRTVPRPIHDRHAPTADHLLQLETSGQDGRFLSPAQRSVLSLVAFDVEGL